MTAQDRRIATAIRQGDAAVFEQLFRQWYAGLVAYGRRFLDNPADAEEAVQDLFCQLWEKRADFDPHVSLRSYLFTAIRNRCYNRIEHFKVRQKSESEVAEGIEARGRTNDPGQLLEGRELEDRIAAAIGDLPERCRQVFVLSRYEGKKYKEIAQELDISPRTVEVQVGKALKHLRTVLHDILPLLMLWWWSGGNK